METVTLLRYSNTNTYLIEGTDGAVLFDTGWAGTFTAFCAELGRNGKRLDSIRYLVISHFHPDHYGIAQEIADRGPVILIPEEQRNFLHASDTVFQKEKGLSFLPVRDEKVKHISLNGSRKVLEPLGIAGELLHTPGHSDDSISLLLDRGDLFVGDLNPLYELELHRGTTIESSWNRLLDKKPRTVYYGHAKTAVLRTGEEPEKKDPGGGDTDRTKWYELTADIMKYIDRGYSLERIARKTGADKAFTEDVARMYLTHTDVGVQGILDRIEIRNR